MGLSPSLSSDASSTVHQMLCINKWPTTEIVNEIEARESAKLAKIKENMKLLRGFGSVQ